MGHRVTRRPCPRLALWLFAAWTTAVACASAGGSSPTTASPPSPAPAASGGCVPATTIVTHRIDYDSDCYTAPAETPFSIDFQNQDEGVKHNLVIRQGEVRDLFQGAVVLGPATLTYQVPALPSGEYRFFCIVHPFQMSGMFIVGGQPAGPS